MSKYLKFMNTPNGVQQIFTREKIGNLPNYDFDKFEKRIYQQLKEVGIPSNSELATENQGKVFIWHTAGDERVCNECDNMDGKIFRNLQDVPDDLHPNCRCYIEEIDLYDV